MVDTVALAACSFFRYVVVGVALLVAGGQTAFARVGTDDRPESVNAPFPDALSGLEISAGIDKAVEYLQQHQIKSTWTWDSPPAAGGGASTLRVTALTLVALTEAGTSGQDPQVRRTMDVLDQTAPVDTATAALGAKLDCSLEFARPNPGKSGAAGALLKAAGLTQGLISYHNAPFAMLGHSLNPNNPDHPSTYLVLMAIDACQKSWADIPDDFWKDADKQLRAHQLPDGGWAIGAVPANALPASDFCGTAAAALALQLTSSHATDLHAFDGCKGNANDAAMDKALLWFEQHADEMYRSLTDGKIAAPCETCWWFESVIRATGHTHINGHNFSAGMANWLIKNQNEDGSWPGGIAETAYGLRCLVENHHSPGFAKLAYATGVHNSAWNERPSDVRNFTAYLGSYCYCNSTQTWEIFDIAQPMDELRGMPVLFISGNNILDFDDRQITKLRKFVECGGMILGNADCANPQFSAGFRQLGKALFPQYEFRTLAPSHLIFEEMFRATHWKVRPTVEGMSNNVRELLILIPEADPSLAWQHNARKLQEPLFQLTTNIHLYATGKEGMLSYTSVIPIELKTNRPWRSVRVAQLRIGNNWNPEPHAWPRMTELMDNECHVKLTSAPTAFGAHQLAECNVAHLTGTAKFSLEPAQRDELKAFVDHGGLLLIDSVGGSTDFADAAQAELKLIFGDQTKELDSAISVESLNVKQEGYQTIERVKYRNYARRTITDAGSSHLRAIHINGRIAVIFSREDLTAGMAGVHADGIIGYDVATSSTLVRNILLYAIASH